MDATLTPTRRFDALDAEQFGEMIESELFRGFLARVQQDLRRAQETCVRSDNDLEIRRSQGAVAALQVVLALPEMMHSEMKAGPRYAPGHTPRPKASNGRA